LSGWYDKHRSELGFRAINPGVLATAITHQAEVIPALGISKYELTLRVIFIPFKKPLYAVFLAMPI